MRSGAHPLLALFEPVVELKPERLYQTLPACYNDLKSADFPQPAKEVILKIFIDWVMQRFPTLSKDEIAKMVLGQLTPLEQTRAAQELIALGEARGEARGEVKSYLAGQIVTLQEVLGQTVSSLEHLKRESIESLEKLKRELQEQLKLRNH